MIYVAGSGAPGRPGGISIFNDRLNQVGQLVEVAELLYLDTDPTGRFLYGVSGVAAAYVGISLVGGFVAVGLGGLAADRLWSAGRARRGAGA